MILRALILLMALTVAVRAQVDYKSPYTVRFSFEEEELIGDLMKGPRANWKDHATVPYSEWYDPGNEVRWSYRGPAAKHFDPPAGLATKSAQWSRERVIATGMRYIGYRYHHHHVPDWDPPADWPRDPERKTPSGKGLDCSNFTSFVYNLALGIKPTSDVQDQAALKEVTGPGRNRNTPVKRLELPNSFEDFAETLLTGDLLYVKNSSGKLSHVVLWVGKIGKSPDSNPLILDSTGGSYNDSNNNEIPDGIQLRAFTPRSWYFKQASHVLRIIPVDDPKS